MQRFAIPATAAAALACFAPVAARAQVYVTSITAAIPDSADAVPGFNKVPGSAIANWANGLAQGVLTQNQYYNYCVSLATATANGKAEVSYKITRGATTIQSDVIIAAKSFKLTSGGIWYLCSGYTELPASPGAATLSGIVTYTPTGGTAVVSKLATSVMLQ